MLLLFILGFFLEWIEISYIALPLFFPYFANLGVDPVWLAILVAINLQTVVPDPRPSAEALFFLKGVAITAGRHHGGYLQGRHSVYWDAGRDARYFVLLFPNSRPGCQRRSGGDG